jgi:hypothetical protein
VLVLKLKLLLVEVMVGLACWNKACRFCPIITDVDRRIASTDTIRVSMGHGFLSRQPTGIPDSRSDGERLTGGYALGPEAGEWLQQVTLAIRARVPLSVLIDVIQPFPTFSEAVFQALRDLNAQVARGTSAPVGVSVG